MPTGKTISKLLTVTDDAPHAAHATPDGVAVPGHREAGAGCAPGSIEADVLDAGDDDPYANLACTD